MSGSFRGCTDSEKLSHEIRDYMLQPEGYSPERSEREAIPPPQPSFTETLGVAADSGKSVPLPNTCGAATSHEQASYSNIVCSVS